MVVGDIALVLEPRGEGINEREGWVGDGSVVGDGRVHQFVHFDQCIGNGGAIVMLKEVLIWYHVALRIADRDGGNDGSGVVCRIIVVAGELDDHAGG